MSAESDDDGLSSSLEDGVPRGVFLGIAELHAHGELSTRTVNYPLTQTFTGEVS
jgi:hypothetical protein